MHGDQNASEPMLPTERRDEAAWNILQLYLWLYIDTSVMLVLEENLEGPLLIRG